MLRKRYKKKKNWLTGKVICQLCGFEWVGIWPAEANKTGLECPYCWLKAGMPETVELYIE